MTFNVKLSMFMNMLNLINADVADGVFVDKTLVSKWRNNKRSIDVNEQYLNKLSEYFAGLLTQQENKKLFMADLAIDNDELFSDVEKLKYILHSWFSDDDQNIMSLRCNFETEDEKNSENSLADSGIKEGFFTVDDMENIYSNFEHLYQYLAASAEPKHIKVFVNGKILAEYDKNRLEYQQRKYLDKFNSLIPLGHRITIIWNCNNDDLLSGLLALFKGIDPELLKGYSVRLCNLEKQLLYYIYMVNNEILIYGNYERSIFPGICYVTNRDSILDRFENTYEYLLRHSEPVDFEQGELR